MNVAGAGCAGVIHEDNVVLIIATWLLSACACALQMHVMAKSNSNL